MTPQKSKRLVIVITDFSLVSGRDFFAGILRYSQRHPEWTIRLMQSPGEVSTEELLTDSSKVAGLITCHMGNASFQETLRQLPFPIVIAGTHVTKLTGRKHPTSYIRLDEESIGRLAAHYFINLGNFAVYAFVPAAQDFLARSSKLRERGFRREILKHKRIFSSFQNSNLSSWLSEIPKPVAVFADDDQSASMVIEACRTTDIPCPSQVSVLGVDNEELRCLSLSPSLSSIKTDSDNEGFQAAHLLSKLMHSRRTGAIEHVVPAHGVVVARRSTRAPAPASVLIRRAETFIRQNLNKNIHVTDISNELGVSRRLLELRFSQYRSYTIHDRIQSLRLEEFSRRLRGDRLHSIRHIAAECGFSDVRYLRKLFVRRYGFPPVVWRATTAHDSNETGTLGEPNG